MAVSPYAQILLWANNAQSTLAGSISNSTTTIALQSGGGAIFPSPIAGEGFPATLTDRATGLLREIVLVTARSGDTLTVARAQEGTTGLSWAANDLFAQLVTAGGLTSLVQGTTAQSQPWNYGVDVGASNAYQVNLVPAVTVPRIGMPFRVLITNTNTGPSTMNYGAGAVNILRADGSACIGNELVAGQTAEFVIESGNVQLMAPSPATAAALAAGTDTRSFVTPAQVGSVFNKIITQTFTGSGTYTPSAGLVYCTIETIGGGGGGGGVGVAISSNIAAGGGGAGGYSRSTKVAADIGASKAVTIGAAGAAGATGDNTGGTGGDTSVGTLVIARGGTGGAGAGALFVGPGGLGGVLGTGDATGTGAPGMTGSGDVTTTAVATGGGGGSGLFGGGAVANATNVGATAIPGVAGSGHGSGGSGAANSAAGGATTQPGGAGTAGYVVITEYCNQ
jgi:hypothetical protein